MKKKNAYRGGVARNPLYAGGILVGHSAGVQRIYRDNRRMVVDFRPSWVRRVGVMPTGFSMAVSRKNKEKFY